MGWSIIETSVYIITGCLPHLRPIVSHYTPPWLKNLARSTISTLRTGSSKSTGRSGGRSGGGGSRYWSSKLSGNNTTTKGSGGGGGGGRYRPDSGQLEEEDAIELTRPTESLRRSSLQDRPLSLEIHPRINTEASADERGAGGLGSIPSPGQIVVTKEILMTRT